MTCRILVGDARTRLGELPDASVHTIVTSPPYWGLRAYEGGEGMIGMEDTLEEHIEALLGVFRECRRVLRPDGTLWLNYGDSYWGGKGRSNYAAAGCNPNRRTLQKPHHHIGRYGDIRPTDRRHDILKPKDLIMMPARVAMALQEDGWWLRSEIIWGKSNPMPESVLDRPTLAHEKVFLLAPAPKYFYDAHAVREPCQSGPSDIRKMEEGRDRIGGKHRALDDPLAKASAATNIGRKRCAGSPSGRNMRSVWEIATAPYRGAHFAVFPAALVEPCIRAGTSAVGVCPECGAPWERVIGRWPSSHGATTASAYGLGSNAPRLEGHAPAHAEHIGWKIGCECGADSEPVAATVLDPFAGAGTVGVVAERLQRDSILVEVAPEYAAMAEERIRNDGGLLAEVERA